MVVSISGWGGKPVLPCTVPPAYFLDEMVLVCHGYCMRIIQV